MTRRSILLLAVLALAFVLLHALLASPFLAADDDYYIVRFMPVEFVLYLGAVLIVLNDREQDPASARRAVTFILMIAAILRVIVIPIDGRSTDINRYVWDGRVAGAGINPYLYIPADPALKALRDDDIYPDINRKEYAPTIYPPLAQVVFYLVTRISDYKWVMKLAMVAFEIPAIWAMMRLMQARALPPTRILLYAWHPLPIWEFAGDGHVDAIAIACIGLSLLAADRGRPILAGMALAGATLTKFFPAAIGPAVYRRWDWRLPLAWIATIAVLYAPYVGGGRKVFGFLSGYSAEEGLRDGSGLYLWLLLKHIWPNVPQNAVALYAPATGLILFGMGAAILFRDRRQTADLFGALVLATTFTVLTSPHYIWYFAWLVPFLCFFPYWSVFWITGAATFMNTVRWPPDFVGGSLVYLPFFVIVALETWVRRAPQPEARRSTRRG